MGAELVPLTPPSTPALPTVQSTDMYAALLADARKETTRRGRDQDVADLAGFLGLGDRAAACSLFVSGGAAQANAIGTAYVRSMLDRELSAATINRRVSTLRRLAVLARRFGVADWSLDVDGLKARAYRDTSGPGTDGMRALVVLAKAEATTIKGKRDWAILALLYSAGLRRAEAEGLIVGDVDLEARKVRVLGKGRHQHEWLPMSRAAAEAIAGWLATRGPVTPDAPLFVRLDRAGTGTERLTHDGLYLIVRTLGRRAGLSRSLAPHGLRHASITRLAERTGGDLPKIQRFSRHAKVETVAVYVDRQRDAAAGMAELLGEDL